MNLENAMFRFFACCGCVSFFISPGCDRFSRNDLKSASVTTTENQLSGVLFEPEQAQRDSETVTSGAELTVEPHVDGPVVSHMTASCHSGAEIGMTLELSIQPGWHITATTGGITQPLRIELTLPDGIAEAGDWLYPDADGELTGTGVTQVYRGRVRFIRTLQVSDGSTCKGQLIRCLLGYQACSQFKCREFEEVEIEARVQ